MINGECSATGQCYIRSKTYAERLGVLFLERLLGSSRRSSKWSTSVLVTLCRNKDRQLPDHLELCSYSRVYDPSCTIGHRILPCTITSSRIYVGKHLKTTRAFFSTDDIHKTSLPVMTIYCSSGSILKVHHSQ